MIHGYQQGAGNFDTESNPTSEKTEQKLTQEISISGPGQNIALQLLLLVVVLC